MKMETVVLDVNLVKSLYNYLYSKPYAEVVQLVSALDVAVSTQSDQKSDGDGDDGNPGNITD